MLLSSPRRERSNQKMLVSGDELYDKVHGVPGAAEDGASLGMLSGSGGRAVCFLLLSV